MGESGSWSRRRLLGSIGVAGLALGACSDSSDPDPGHRSAAPQATPSTPVGPGNVRIVMIVRHAEKPAGALHGVTADGDKDKESLTTVGWSRAGALVGVFAPGVGAVRPGLVRPRALIAADPGSSGSKRPAQTLAPLAARLGLHVDTTHHKTDVTGAARTAAGLGGPTLLSWQHELIPSLARGLGAIAPDVPSDWPDDRFDLVWVFRSTDGTRWDFSEVPQLLLAGDSAHPIT